MALKHIEHTYYGNRTHKIKILPRIEDPSSIVDHICNFIGWKYVLYARDISGMLYLC